MRTAQYFMAASYSIFPAVASQYVRAARRFSRQLPVAQMSQVQISFGSSALASSRRQKACFLLVTLGW